MSPYGHVVAPLCICLSSLTPCSTTVCRWRPDRCGVRTDSTSSPMVRCPPGATFTHVPASGAKTEASAPPPLRSEELQRGDAHSGIRLTATPSASRRRSALLSARCIQDPRPRAPPMTTSSSMTAAAAFAEGRYARSPTPRRRVSSRRRVHLRMQQFPRSAHRQDRVGMISAATGHAGPLRSTKTAVARVDPLFAVPRIRQEAQRAGLRVRQGRERARFAAVLAGSPRPIARLSP